MNFLDRAISYFSPQSGVARAKARLVERNLHNLKERGYEAAGRGRRFASWNPKPGQSVNDVVSKDLKTLIARSHDLFRNNPYANRAGTVISSNVVGSGIIPTATGRNSEKVEEMWLRWGETSYCDFDGRHDIYGLQSLKMNTTVRSGTVLIRRVYVRPKDPKRDLNIKVQLLEPEFLDTDMNYERGELYCVNGIEFNSSGERTGYWIFPEHPTSTSFVKGRKKSVLVPAKDIHPMYRVERPGQLLGVPWLAPVMLKLRDYDDYEDAQLLTKKMSACFGVFIKKRPEDDLGPQKREGEEPDPYSVEPGIVMEGLPGDEPVLITPPSVADLSEFSRISLQAIATGMGITYESLTQDLGRVNFSSGRMGWLEMNRNLKTWRRDIAIPASAVIYGWFLESCAIAGIDTSDIKFSWTEPRREAIDVTKETEAEKTAIRMGKKSLTETILENGGDPDRTFSEIAKERKLFAELGLVFDSDAGAMPGSTPVKPEPKPEKEDNNE